MSHYANEARRTQSVRRQVRKELDTLRRMWIEGVVSVTLTTRSGALTLSPAPEHLNAALCALRDDLQQRREELGQAVAGLQADHVREVAATHQPEAK